MKKITRPPGMEEELKDKDIDKMLVHISQWVTDGSIQKLYERYKYLENKLDSLGIDY